MTPHIRPPSAGASSVETFVEPRRSASALDPIVSALPPDGTPLAFGDLAEKLHPDALVPAFDLDELERLGALTSCGWVELTLDWNVRTQTCAVRFVRLTVAGCRWRETFGEKTT